MVTSTGGDGIVLLGCVDTVEELEDTMYEMKIVAGSLKWEILPQKLQYKRGAPVAMYIPDEMVLCN